MIETIAVVGRDFDAWLTAYFLQKMLGLKNNNRKVIFIELPSKLNKKEVVSTMPSMRAMHGLLGFSEINLLKSCRGAITLGQRYTNWSSSGKDFMQVFDTAGTSLNGVDFFQYWIKAKQNGLKASLDDFSLAGVCAKLGRVAQNNNRVSKFSNFEYGYNFPAINYLKVLAPLTIKSGVKHVTGEISHVVKKGKEINSIKLKSGEIVKADLFVDASGEDGVLIGEFKDGGFRDWKDYFVCDSVMVVEGLKLSPTPVFNQITAVPFGWFGIFPTLDKSTLMFNYNSECTDNESIYKFLKSLYNFKDDEFYIKNYCVGGRSKPWLGNCVAVGEALSVLDNILSPQSHVLFSSLSQLITLFPIEKDMEIESEIYNKNLSEQIESIRNLQLSYYFLAKNKKDFWGHYKEINIPEKIQNKINLYSARGMVPIYENESFQEDSWRYLLSGVGFIPETYSPLVDKVSEESQIKWFRDLLKFLSEEAAQMPILDKYLEN